MSVKVYQNNAWQEISSVKQYISGVWSDKSSIKIYNSGGNSWVEKWSSGLYAEAPSSYGYGYGQYSVETYDRNYDSKYEAIFLSETDSEAWNDYGYCPTLSFYILPRNSSITITNPSYYIQYESSAYTNWDTTPWPEISLSCWNGYNLLGTKYHYLEAGFNTLTGSFTNGACNGISMSLQLAPKDGDYYSEIKIYELVVGGYSVYFKPEDFDWQNF